MESEKKRLADMLRLLTAWYPSHARDLPWRKDREPYHVWLSEIMLQQTRVEAVKEYYKRFLAALPTIETLAKVEDDYLLKLWQGLGYYNRAKNLKKAAITVCSEYAGTFPNTYDAIRALPGIGDYTAGAIGSICFDLQTPAVDGNVLRVYARVMEDDSNVDKVATKNIIRDKLAEVYPQGKSGIATQSLMELGATVCLPNGTPKCEQCPLAGICLAHINHTWDKLPVREAKKARQIVDKTVFILQCGEYYALRKRPSKGLLSGMWEFPNVDAVLTEQAVVNQAADWAVEPEHLMMKTSYTHIFTHVEWRMSAYYMKCRQMSSVFQWATREEIAEYYAVPSAFRPFYDSLEYMENKK